MRRAMLTASKPNPLAGVNIGDAFMGGYYAGTMDTTKGNIVTADASQTGKRYALIVAPKTLENASVQYGTANTSAPAAADTRWDGLTATGAMNSSAWPAAQYCAGLTHPSDNGSAWYLPAMDELELIYRNLKCSTELNYTTAKTGSTFPGTTQNQGYNPSSDPAGAAYTSTTPGQTSVAVFQSGGPQALGVSGTVDSYWSATDYSATYAWVQQMSGNGTGYQGNAGTGKNNPFLVRPVRRLILT